MTLELLQGWSPKYPSYLNQFLWNMVTEMNNFSEGKQEKLLHFQLHVKTLEMKCTWTLTSMIWSMDFITSACKRPCPKWYSLNRMNEWPKFPSKNKNLEKTYCALIMPPGKQKLTMTHSSGWRDWLDLTNGMLAPTAKLMTTWKMERSARVAKKINKTQNRRGDWVVWF